MALNKPMIMMTSQLSQSALRIQNMVTIKSLLSQLVLNKVMIPISQLTLLVMMKTISTLKNQNPSPSQSLLLFQSNAQEASTDLNKTRAKDAQLVATLAMDPTSATPAIVAGTSLETIPVADNVLRVAMNATKEDSAKSATMVGLLNSGMVSALGTELFP